MSAPDFSKPPLNFAPRRIQSSDIRRMTETVSSIRTVVNAIVSGQQAKAELKRMDAEKQTAMRAGVERLKAKLASASTAVSDVTMHLEEHADRILSRRDEIMNRSDKVCAPHAAMMDETDHGLDDLDAALQVMGNGAPLPSSES